MLPHLFQGYHEHCVTDHDFCEIMAGLETWDWLLKVGTRDKGWVSYLFWVSHYTDIFCSDFVMLINILS